MHCKASSSLIGAQKSLPAALHEQPHDGWCWGKTESQTGFGVAADKQGYQQSYDAALVGADRSKDIVVVRLLNLQVSSVAVACTAEITI